MKAWFTPGRCAAIGSLVGLIISWATGHADVAAVFGALSAILPSIFHAPAEPEKPVFPAPKK